MSVDKTAQKGFLFAFSFSEYDQLTGDSTKTSSQSGKPAWIKDEKWKQQKVTFVL